MNHPTATPRPKRSALARRWGASLLCLLLLATAGTTDELYDFVATDLRGTPALVNFRSARRSVARSRRQAVSRRRQRESRLSSRRTESRRLVRSRKKLRLGPSTPARTATARTSARATAPRRTRRARSTRLGRRIRPAANAATTAPPSTGGPVARREGAGASSRTAPGTSPIPIPNAPPRSAPGAGRTAPPILAQRSAEELEEENTGAGGEDEVEVRQNLSLAFVTPRGAPAEGVRLIARVLPAEGSELVFSTLATDSSGRVRLRGIDLPASIELDFPGSGTTPEGADPEWDFAQAEQATLLLESPLGASRLESAPGASANARTGTRAVRRVRLFEGEAAPIVLERQVVDLVVSAPPNSTLSSPAFEPASGSQPARALTVPESGRLGLRLPREALEEGPIPIRVARSLAGGEAEALIERYSTDAYEANAVEAPPLKLARLSQIEIAGRVGVMGTDEAVARRLGDLDSPANDNGAIGEVKPMSDGSEWWIYPVAGVAFKMRPAPGTALNAPGPAMLVERVRLLTRGAGSLGTVSVNSSLDQVREALGEPQSEDEARTPSDVLSAPGQVDSWLDGGVRVCHDGERVLWLEAARPNSLLTGGTTAFVRRARARLFIESFQGHEKIGPADAPALRKYLESAYFIDTVDSPEEADLVLRARVAEVGESGGNSGATPAQWRGVARLDVLLFDTSLGRSVGERQVRGSAVSEAAGEAAQASVASALEALAGEVNRAADFSVRVTSIDYSAGTLRLNAGLAQGLRASRDDPDDFQITVAGAGLPRQDSEDSSLFYVARVVAVGDDWATCRLLRVSHTLRKRGESLRESVTEEPALDMLRRIPDPATGLIAARSWTPAPAENAAPSEPRRPQQPGLARAPRTSKAPNAGRKSGGLRY